MEPDVFRRFCAKIQKTAGCWIWTGAKISSGYSELRVGGKPEYGHRLSYEHFKGKIPDGLVIDHLCRNPSCVNPDHLEAVTTGENTARGESREKLRERATSITHCPAGHAYTETNTLLKRGRRHCRTCRAEESRVRCGRRYWEAKGLSREEAEAKVAVRQRVRANSVITY